ncbi:hypothetical protein A4U53_021220 [Rhizobium ruizarguesonis]|uniref:Uncharacterized protein n=2 Tax=Rhizobium TaxID=379 RepID=A0A179BD76_RHILE|nr:hypothetical protein [Rhizobium leguminosarum]OAP89091.1 hypothetical protein A4U53_33285 [Rhizobium leguminosarum]
MGRIFKYLILLMVMTASTSVNVAAEGPRLWRKTMTNDPSTNFYLAETLKILLNKDDETSMCSGCPPIAGNLGNGVADWM